MRTGALPDGRSTSDLTARARIRDAAIECFGESGFATPYRAIAARAEVSPGLITHHYGSKDALRAECDAEVLRRYHVLKSDALGNPTGSLLGWLAEPGGSAIVLAYMLRTVHAGGQPARDFLESLVDHTRELMAEGVASGFLRPSRDEEARVRYLTYQSMGAMLVQLTTTTDVSPDAFVASLVASYRETVLPTLELYTEGMLTSREMLDSYLDDPA